MTDLDTEIAEKRAELGRVMHEIVLAREVSATLLSHARAVKAQAEADAAAMLNEARELAQRALADAGVRSC